LSKKSENYSGASGIKTEMTTKELAEMVFGKPAEYKTKEYSSISRSLNILEKKGLIKRAHVQIRWRLELK
jgi:predicted transcriptional regulator